MRVRRLGCLMGGDGHHHVRERRAREGIRTVL